MKPGRAFSYFVFTVLVLSFLFVQYSLLTSQRIDAEGSPPQKLELCQQERQRLRQDNQEKDKSIQGLKAQLAEVQAALKKLQNSNEPINDVDVLADAGIIADKRESLDTDSNLRPETTTDWMPPAAMRNFLYGMGRVRRKEFVEKFDTGHGIDPEFKKKEGEYREDEEVLLLYSSPSAFPSNWTESRDSTVMPVKTAVQNCRELRVLHLPRKRHKSLLHAPANCLAVVGNWGNHHVPRFTQIGQGRRMRFEHIPAYRGPKSIPTTAIDEAASEELAHYISIFPQVLKRLEPVAASVAKQSSSVEKKGKKKKPSRGTIIIMVANQGHSMFLINFVCAARSRGLDMSHILLFATDLTTQELANDLGLTSYYDQDLFGKLPTSAAVNYTDINYGKMMVSKVYVAHLISRLGYDFLFQDTDLAWYRDPLHYFETHAKPGFDMYFQHDGWHHPLRFAPFAANTGFYFVRYNERTEHFFSMLSRMTDIIYMDKSHQSAVAMLLNEHTVQRGLKVKVLADDDNYFQSKFRSWIPSTSVSDAFPYIMLCLF